LRYTRLSDSIIQNVTCYLNSGFYCRMQIVDGLPHFSIFVSYIGCSFWVLDSYQNPHWRSPVTYFTCRVNFKTKMDERLHVVFANNVIYLDNYYKQLYSPNLNKYNNTLFPLLMPSTSFPLFYGAKWPTRVCMSLIQFSFSLGRKIPVSC
jgi:hypothetical protein